jgi:hypothetical protein
MASVICWYRIEPDLGDSATVVRSAEARVHDPLWFLARQWQLGEFGGCDGGSPILARGEIRSSAISAFAPRALAPDEVADGEPLGPGQALEPLIEREPLPPPRSPLGARLGAEAGAQLAVLLAEAGLGALRPALVQAFAVTAEPQMAERDPRGFDRLELLRGRIIDGAAVRAALGADVPGFVERWPGPPLTGAQRSELVAVLARFAAWYDGWIDAREVTPPRGLDVGFSIGVGDVALAAPSYTGELEWHAFDVVPGGRLREGTAPQSSVIEPTIPTAVTFPGKAQNRFWELEDAAVELAKVAGSEGGLVRGLLLEFVLVSGVDWFVVPVTLPNGAMHELTRFEVSDTFGDRAMVPALASGSPAGRRFAFWRLEGSDASRLLLPDASGRPLQSESVERLQLIRDEASNLVWAVEDWIEGFLRPVSLHERPVETATAGGEPRYRAQSLVPPGFFPLFPDGAQLRVGTVLSATGAARDIRARALETLAFHLEALPSEGAELSRSFQWLREASGRSVLWLGRSVGPARTPPSPSIQFDTIE